MSELTSKSPDNEVSLIKANSLESEKLADIYDVVNDDFVVVNNLIPQMLSSEVELVEEIGSYIVKAGGKRFRPLLVLLTSGLFLSLIHI